LGEVCHEGGFGGLNRRERELPRAWGGATPASDEEAIERILDAASAAIDERGAAMRVVDVARPSKCPRQTIFTATPVIRFRRPS
jgi:hypothetical protein